MKKGIVILLAALCLLSVLSGCAKKEEEAPSPYLSGKHHVEIEIQDYGTLTVELDADAAPISVTNFIDLAGKGFYDGLTFHRLTTSGIFVLQGGDPKGNGTGGSENHIRGEFSANGVSNPLSHTRGAIAMARSTDNNSATSQFYIVYSDSTQLDGNYAVFGYVTEGMEVVDAVVQDTPTSDSNGSIRAANQPVITAIRVLD